MKKYIYITFLIGVVLLSSCLVDDTAPEDQYSSASNLFTFSSSTLSFGMKANGDSYDRVINMRIKGPSLEDISGEVTATIVANPDKTSAVEGTHYSLPSATIKLSATNNFLGQLPIKILSKGIVAPLSVNPVLTLKVSTVDGAGNIIASGQDLSITLNYLCTSNLQGMYSTTIERDNGSVYNYSEEIKKIGEGEYRGESVGHWTPGSIGGTPGFTFTDVCNTISLLDQNLVDLYSNQVRQVKGNSSVDPDTGIITIRYGIYSTWEAEYVVTYTPK